MFSRRIAPAVPAVALSLAAAIAPAQAPQAPGAGDWPQWRGPERTGVSRETGLLKNWPPGGPKLPRPPNPPPVPAPRPPVAAPSSPASADEPVCYTRGSLKLRKTNGPEASTW